MKKKREFTVIIEQDDEGYFVAEVPELRSCYTQATTMDQLMTRLQEVIELCIQEQRPRRSSLKFVGLQRISV